jgi:hypothetical protein
MKVPWIFLAFVAAGVSFTDSPVLAAENLKDQITVEDEEEYFLCCHEYFSNILNAMSSPSPAGEYSCPQFEDVDIPVRLKETFTPDAIKEYFSKNNDESIFSQVLSILARTNWIWRIVYTGDEYTSGKYCLQVNLHNYTELFYIQSVTLHIDGVGLFQLPFYNQNNQLKQKGAAANRDAIFRVLIDTETFKNINKTSKEAKITKLIWK